MAVPFTIAEAHKAQLQHYPANGHERRTVHLPWCAYSRHEDEGLMVDPLRRIALPARASQFPLSRSHVLASMPEPSHHHDASLWSSPMDIFSLPSWSHVRRHASGQGDDEAIARAKSRAIYMMCWFENITRTAVNLYIFLTITIVSLYPSFGLTFYYRHPISQLIRLSTRLSDRTLIFLLFCPLQF